MNFRLERRRGLLLVVSAPSGGGKSSVLKLLRERDPALGYSVSYTSRAPRPGDVDGKTYHFVSRERFGEMIDAGAFYEHAEVHGNLYGTSAEVVEQALGQGRGIALDIDVQGGLAIKKRLPEALLVFLLPPSMATLEKRLRGRATDQEEAVRIRMENARQEMAHWSQYDYVVVNDDLEGAISDISQILTAESRRAARLTLVD